MDLNVLKTVAVMYAIFVVAKRKPEKIQACKGFEPMTFSDTCSPNL